MLSKVGIVHRGDIVLADFGATVGSVQRGIRPAFIVQNDKGNRYAPTVIAAPITSQMKHAMPTHLTLHDVDGLTKTSTVLFEQMATLDYSQIIEHLGHYKCGRMVDLKILIALGCATFLSPQYMQYIRG